MIARTVAYPNYALIDHHKSQNDARQKEAAQREFLPKNLSQKKRTPPRQGNAQYQSPLYRRSLSPFALALAFRHAAQPRKKKREARTHRTPQKNPSPPRAPRGNMNPLSNPPRNPHNRQRRIHGYRRRHRRTIRHIQPLHPMRLPRRTTERIQRIDPERRSTK